MQKRTILSNTSKWIFYAGMLLALLPIMILRDFTPDNELRYLSIVEEALRNHDFFAFHNHGVPYADKPPLYFWLLMLCRWIAGQHYMWLLALCSLLPAFAVIAIMEKWSAGMSGILSLADGKDRENCCIAARMMLMTSAYFLGAAVILRMDMLMCLFIVLSLYTFWKMYVGNTARKGKVKTRDKWLFPIYLFLALFTKGPLGIIIPLFSILVFLLWKRRISHFARYWGWRTWGVLLGLCTLWFLGVYADGGSEYLNNLLFHQTIDRAVDSFHHKRPFYYYLIAMWYIIAPWSLYVIGAIVADLRNPSKLSTLQQFFITIGVSTLVLLSCISSKLQIYFLPAIPFMVYAAMMSVPEYKDKILTKIAIGFPAAILFLALPAMGLASHFNLLGEYESPIVWDMATLMTAGGFYGLFMLVRKGVYATVKSVFITLMAVLFVGGFALSGVNSSLGYGELCKEAKEMALNKGIDKIYVWKIKRPENMDVYLGHEIVIIDNDSVPRHMNLGKSLLLVKEEDSEQFNNKDITKVGPYAIVTNEK